MTIRKRDAIARKRVPTRRSPVRPTVSQKIVAIGARIPDKDLARLPKDGAENLDHYLYGAPKRS